MSELFMEHPPFVAGQTIRFAVHLTRLKDFAAVKTGRPRIEFTPEAGGSPVVLAGTDALRPGAFRVDKYWSPVGRVDNVYGDRNLVCSCPPVADYAEAAE